MEETTGKTKKTITFHEFICQRQFTNDRESRVLAFAEYFLFYFDSFEQLSEETGIPRVDIDEILITRLKEIDSLMFQQVMEKAKQGNVIRTADYIISTGASTRKAAERFGVSNATISYWMTNKLPELDYKRCEEYLNVKNKNKAKSVEDEEVVARIKAAIDLIISGLTIKEAATVLKSTEMTIARDLERRLSLLSAEDIEDIGKEKITKLSEVLKFHSASHPKKQSRK